MSEINKEDNELLKRIVDLTRLHEQDSQIIEGQNANITKLEVEAEYSESVILRAQQEIGRLHKELGR